MADSGQELIPRGAVFVRPAGPADLLALPALEAAGDAMFADLGMSMPPDHVTPNALAAGDVMVIGAAADPDSDGPADELVPAAVVGFSLFELPDPDGTDGQQLAHLAQLSVHPRYGRRGLGRALLGGTVGRAAARGAAVLTLTTFADVPWNAPFYLRCGFIELPAERWPGYLRDHRNAEIKSGLDALGPRVALALPLR